MTSPLTPVRPRGACPTLAAPMLVADGLLVRFRPSQGFSPQQLAALGKAAEAFGNGRVEVTARGSVQVRGLSATSEDAFRNAMDEAGIEVKTGVVIECSPVAGDDPKELRNPLALVCALETLCPNALERGALSPKLSIVIESGGQISLAGNKADIRLSATHQGWAIEVGDMLLDELVEADVPAAVDAILRQLQTIGPRARGCDLARTLTASHARAIERATSAVEPDARQFLRIPVSYGQVHGSSLVNLANFMRACGISEARPAPERTFVLMGASVEDAPALSKLGFGTSGMSLCSGAEATEGGIIHAADLARALDSVDTELAGLGLHLHVSTCSKGCAHKGRAGIMLAGDSLSLYEGGTQKPFARLDPAAIEAGLVSIAAHIRSRLPTGA